MLSPGDLFLFKLHSPNNHIVGGGFFETASLLPVSLAWETFRMGNGVRSLAEMRDRIAKYRREPLGAGQDPIIGNISLQQPFFFRREAWIPSPPDFSLDTVQGKSYDLDVGTGRDIWRTTRTTALRGCEAAYFLTHSVGARGDEYRQRDLEIAETFGRSAAAAGVRRILYLGGLGDSLDDLSNHLLSRREVETALGTGGVPVTVLRATMIIGSAFSG